MPNEQKLRNELLRLRDVVDPQDVESIDRILAASPTEITDSQLLEFAMAHLMIVEDAGPQTRRIYDTREAIIAAMKESQKP